MRRDICLHRNPFYALLWGVRGLEMKLNNMHVSWEISLLPDQFLNSVSLPSLFHTHSTQALSCTIQCLLLFFGKSSQ